jgi:photosystem II stability/assembly factor-like uncharacterized protein
MRLFNIIILFLLYTLTLFSQWESIGPYGGYIRCLIKDNSGRALSGNAYGGIFRTSDAGKNWEQLFTGYRNEDVRSLAVNSNNHIFAGTDLHGLYRSIDDGISWERLINSVSTRTINDILIKSNGDIYLATFNGVYRSTDNGNTFSTANNGITTSSIYSLGLSGDYIFAGTGNAGIFRSGDDGANWEAANTGINLSDGIVWGFASAEETENVGAVNIHALLQNDLYRSVNGTDWTSMSLPSQGLNLDVLLRNNGHLVVVGDKILNSTDQGNSWNIYNSPTEAFFSSVIEIDDNTLVGGTQGPGTYVSTNNNLADWNLEVNKMPATAITNINSTAGVINVSTRHSGIFRTNDGGLNWLNLSTGIPNGWFYGLYQHPTTNTLFALHQNGVYRSTDDGQVWDQTSAFGKTMAVNSLGDIFVGGGSYISKSIDDGISYQHKQISTNVFYSLDIAIDKDDKIYIATANDFGLQGQGVFLSTDLGESYSPIVELPNDITSVEALDLTGFPSVFDCIKEVLAADANGNFYSKNDDGSWNQFNIGFQLGGFVKDIAAINYLDGVNISTITEKEMFSTSDQSNCISEEEDELPDDTFFLEMGKRFGLGSQLLKPGATTITDYVGTLGLGILKRESVNDINDIKNSIPKHFDLQQNYPNPFNPSTKISWQSPISGHQTLKVYDVLGNEVAILVNEYKTVGNFSVDFDASRFASGVYLYRLQVINPETSSGQGFVETKKMILQK